MWSFKNNIIIVLFIAVLFLVYWVGKMHGSSQVKQTVIENVDLVKEIAELSSLSVQGSTHITVSNADAANANWLGKIKNYLVENTLSVTIPYEAKYGVNLDSTHKLKGAKDKDTVFLEFPSCKLLSLQLQMDKLQTLNKTGIFNTTSITELAEAQKQLYSKALLQLQQHPAYIQKAQQQVVAILQKYYTPLGVKAVVSFR